MANLSLVLGSSTHSGGAEQSESKACLYLMKTAKKKIKQCVTKYKRVFPEEYKGLVDLLSDKRGQMEIDDNDWAELKKADAVERHIFDIPHTLYTSFVSKLDEDEMDWLYAREDYLGDFTGLRWFITTYPEFRVTKEY